MLTFKEFQKEAAYLPLDQQKERYKWYLKGARELMNRVACSVEDYCDSITYCDDCCPKKSMYDVDDQLEELEKQYAETEEN